MIIIIIILRIIIIIIIIMKNFNRRSSHGLNGSVMSSRDRLFAGFDAAVSFPATCVTGCLPPVTDRLGVLTLLTLHLSQDVQSVAGANLFQEFCLEEKAVYPKSPIVRLVDVINPLPATGCVGCCWSRFNPSNYLS